MIMFMNIKNEIKIENLYFTIAVITCFTNVLRFENSAHLTSFFQYLSIVLGVLFFVDKIKKHEVKIAPKILIIFSLLSLSSIAVFFINDYGWTIENLGSLFCRILMVNNLFLINNKKNYNSVFNITIYLSLLIGIVNFIIYYFADWIKVEKFRGIYSNGQPGGSVAMISLVIAIYYFANNKGNYKVNFLCIIFNLFFLCKAINRSAIFAIVGTVLLLIITRLEAKKRRMIFTLMGVFVCLLIFVLSYNITLETDPNHFKGLELLLYNKSSHRYGLYKDSIMLFLKNPIFGVSNYNLKEAAIREIGANSTIGIRGFSYTHNIFLEVATNGGLFSLIPFGYFSVYILRTCYKRLIVTKVFDFDNLYVVLVLISLLYCQLDAGIVGYLLIVSFYFWISCNKILKESGSL